METLAPEFSPNKRPKIETETLNPPLSPSSAKGKAPISGDDDDDDGGYESPTDLLPQNCGICFSEEGKSVRGLIDCCSHYFCFLCIIEWSKIESRCPLCRGRFGTIRRMRKDGTFIGDGCVRIPVRDQLYDQFGEPVDPYAQAKCIVCNGSADECLLLLCDLCDSPWHTYCVGLGVTVPEGDWYCRDCALLRAEQHDSEMNDNVENLDDNVDTSTTSNHVNEESSSTTASVSIFDIVRDPVESEHRPVRGVDRLRKLVSPTKKFSCAASGSVHANTAHAGRTQGSGGKLGPLVDLTESSARTLRNCRNVRKHINVLRDNWDAFRAGSLSFSSDLLVSTRKGGRTINAVAKRAERSCDSHSSSTPSSFQSKAQDTCNALHSKNPYDVDRAWRLMNIAKSMDQGGKSKSASKTACIKAYAGKTTTVAKCAPLGQKYVTPCASGMQISSDKLSGRPPQRSGKHLFTGAVPGAANTSSSKSQNSSMSRLSLSTKVQPPSQADSYQETASLSSSGKLGRGLDDGFACSTSSCWPIAKPNDMSLTKLYKKEISTRPREQGRGVDNFSKQDAEVGPTKNICSKSLCRPTAGTFDISCTKLSSKEMSTHPHHLRTADNFSTCEAEVQTSAQTDICKKKVGLPSAQNLGGGLSNVFDEYKGTACSTSSDGPLPGASDASHDKSCGEEVSACPSRVGTKIADKISKDDEAKGEIQSLVKLNLKLLSKDKRLGVDAFKDIARLSTHTILAACGFEHRKIIRPCPTITCNHTDEMQHRRSTLMPSSCRQCFYLFVKNVVYSIMSEKLDTSDVAC